MEPGSSYKLELSRDQTMTDVSLGDSLIKFLVSEEERRNGPWIASCLMLDGVMMQCLRPNGSLDAMGVNNPKNLPLPKQTVPENHTALRAINVADSVMVNQESHSILTCNSIMPFVSTPISTTGESLTFTPQQFSRVMHEVRKSYQAGLEVRQRELFDYAMYAGGPLMNMGGGQPSYTVNDAPIAPRAMRQIGGPPANQNNTHKFKKQGPNSLIDRMDRGGGAAKDFRQGRRSRGGRGGKSSLASRLAGNTAGNGNGGRVNENNRDGNNDSGGGTVDNVDQGVRGDDDGGKSSNSGSPRDNDATSSKGKEVDLFGDFVKDFGEQVDDADADGEVVRMEDIIESTGSPIPSRVPSPFDDDDDWPGISDGEGGWIR